MSFDEAMAIVRQALPPQSVLCGMNIRQDVEWLHLEEHKDFNYMIDLATLFRVWNDKIKKPSFTYFGLDHVATHWLNVNRSGAGGHNAADDAMHSIQLFNTYCTVQYNPPLLFELQQRTLNAKVAPSFAKLNPTFEDCCMGNRKTCKCGAPFFS